MAFEASKKVFHIKIIIKTSMKVDLRIWNRNQQLEIWTHISIYSVFCLNQNRDDTSMDPIINIVFWPHSAKFMSKCIKKGRKQNYDHTTALSLNFIAQENKDFRKETDLSHPMTPQVLHFLTVADLIMSTNSG